MHVFNVKSGKRKMQSNYCALLQLSSREPGTEERPCLPVLPDHKAFIQEFTEFTTEVSQEAHAEKVRHLLTLI